MAGRSRYLSGGRDSATPGWIIRLFPILLFALSLAPRLVALGRYVTPDEAIWAYRSIQFREALLAGNWAGTLVAGHPGVTTTWLGALGITTQLGLAPESRPAYDWLTTMAYLTPDNVEAFERLALFLNGGRVAVALVNSLGIVGIYFLVRRLWGRPTAMVAGLFLALDPFLLGLSGLLHVDGLSATFVTLSLLALAVGLQSPVAGEPSSRRRSWLALAGLMAGLAALSKTPTLLLLPITGLALLWPIVANRRAPLRERLVAFILNGLAWMIPFLLTTFILFPALWASPGDVLAIVGGSANRHLDEALRETFFLGQTAFNHGPLFYPVVLLWRLSPVVWLAIIPAVWLWSSRRRSTEPWPPAAFAVVLLVAWCILFLAAITPAAKKFDRYILPVVPSLLILAALAWVGWVERPGVGRWALPLIVTAQILFWVVYSAYPLTAYNPLVGGPRTAVGVLPIGWGEGISASGRRLAETQTHATQERAIAGIAPSLAPFFPGQTLVDGLDDPATADYTIVTLGGLQLDPVAFEAQIAGLELILTEHFGGLDQAWVYRRTAPEPPQAPADLAETVIFGERLGLTAYGQSVDGDTISLTARWRRLAALAADERYTLRITIRDGQGNVWAANEVDLLNAVYFFPPDWESDESGIVRYLLELPPGIPPSTYAVTLSLIDNRSAGELPVRVEGGSFQGVTYEAGSIEVPLPETIVSASRMRIPARDGVTWLDGRLQLLGHSDVAAEALAGSRLPVDLFWHVPHETLPAGMSVAWRLRPVAESGDQVISTEPLSRFDTGQWHTGESIQEKYQVPLPPDLPPGDYELAVEPLLADGSSAGEPYSLAEIQLNNIDRAYALPDDIAVPLNVAWEPLALKGMDPAELTTHPGDSPEFTLYWQSLQTHADVYTVFVHVLNENGETVLQADHWPGGLPTDILDEGQVITDRVTLLPGDLPPGEYAIHVGLYVAETGRRLPVLDSGGSELIGTDTVVLPVILQVENP